MAEKAGRLIGIDVGSKRVGLARSDPFNSFASTIGTYSPVESFGEIKRQIKSAGPVIGFVVGWPLTPQGARTHATGLVEEYVKKLRKKFPDTDVHMVDERFSSRDARRILVESGVPKKKRSEKGRVDEAVAAYLLQQFLESNSTI